MSQKRHGMDAEEVIDDALTICRFVKSTYPIGAALMVASDIEDALMGRGLPDACVKWHDGGESFNG